MVSSEPFHFSKSSMANNNTPKQNGGRSKPTSFSFFSDHFIFAGGALVACLLFWAIWSFAIPSPTSNTGLKLQTNPTFSLANPIPETHQSLDTANSHNENRLLDPPNPTFYDDPKLTYTIERPMKNWDEKRQEWLKLHPSFANGAKERVIMVTGSQAKPCKNPIGDHLLLRFFKNKVDYCRLHGYDIFYNNVLLQPQMFSFWAKVPTVKATMLAHPEAEWIWWVDSDAAFTDMDFKLPFERYKTHNFVVHGWPHLIYEKKSWTSLNAGVFLIRNCQWSMDFMEVWADMGPQSKEYDRWGKTLSSTFKDKIFPESDDQSGLVYLLLKEKEKWGGKIYIESQFYFEGYWMEIVGRLDNMTQKYIEIEKNVKNLRRRHAEKVHEGYANMWEEYLKEAGYGLDSWRRPFITHFTGCQPCSGKHNQMYSGQNCWEAMQRALTFADNQVLRNYGFVHPNPVDGSTVLPIPFNFPA